MDYGKLLSDSDPQTLKSQVSLAAVVQAHGVELRPAGERLVGLCPFHDDHDASFAVWRIEDDVELCGCWACDFRPGDVYDFLRRKLSITFAEALRLVLDYSKNPPPPAVPIPERVVDPNASERIRSEVESTEGQGLRALAELLIEKNHPATAEWVAQEFRVGVRRDKIVIPHYGPDGELGAAKWRTVDRKPIAFDGSRLTALYGAWRDLGRKRVVLCEGESDTWAVAWLLRDQDVDVLGLPGGVSQRPADGWVETFAGRSVTLMFDFDEAGRRGAWSWINALHGKAHSVLVAALPEGEDAVSSGPETVIEAWRTAWTWTSPDLLPMKRSSLGYVKHSADGERTNVLSNFTLNVHRVVVGEDGGYTFEVTVSGSNNTTPIQLPDSVLIDQNKFKRWASREFLGSWKGGARETMELQELIKTEAMLCPRLRGTTVVGLHDDTFVLPGGTIGSSGWAFLTPQIDTNLGRSIRLNEGDTWSPAVLAALRDLHRRDIITPLLGWVAAAPLRSLVPRFPIFACVGGAGWGKTTLVQTVLEAFGFWVDQPTTITSTTPFALTAMVGGTNAIPVWVDEYRAGARKETKIALDQIIRDAWDGSSGYKGTVRDGGGLELATYTARAPLLITGEDGFSETSHAERMVIVPIPREGKNPDALAAVREVPHAGLGRAYLRWLVSLLRTDELPRWPDVDNRHGQAMAVVRWGWELLHQFAAESGVDLGDLDLSTVDREYVEMSKMSPYEEALREGIGQIAVDGRPIVWEEGDDICVRVQPLVAHVSRNTDIVLPGSSRAMQSYLSERWTISSERRPEFRFLRLRGARAEVISST